MKRFISLLLGWLPKFEVMPDLEEYNLEARPQRNVQVEKSRKPLKGEVFNGREANTTEVENGTETTYINGAPAVASEVVIDAYDMAFFDAEVGVSWRSNDGLAKVIKWHWLQERSAKKIEEFHRSQNSGQLPEGYSTRNVAKYIKALYAADEARASDGKKRLRKPPTGNGNAHEVTMFTPLPADPNEVDW